MSNRLFVGGLPWAVDDNGLQDAFASFGEITDCKVITDRDTGRSRGFGFVTFSSSDDARSALNAMNGAELDGRTLNVDIAQDRGGSRRPSGGGGRDNRW